MQKEIVIELERDAQNAGITAFRIDYSGRAIPASPRR